MNARSTTLTQIITDLGSLLLPASCVRCDRTIRRGVLCGRCQPPPPNSPLARCRRCFSALATGSMLDTCLLCDTIPLPMSTIRFAWDYSGDIAILVSIMKYRPLRALAREFATALIPALDPRALQESIDCIVAMPSSPTSLRARGFNQCDLMAAFLSRALKIPLERKALYHRGARHRQASLESARRFRNVRNVFQAQRAVVEHKNILLFDDVITTGATILEATLALLDAGAAQVHVITLARASTWNEHRQAAARELLHR